MNIICPYRDCQQRIEVTPEDAGAQASCPACDRPMKVPELSAFPPEEVAAMEVAGLDELETPSRLATTPITEPPDIRRPAHRKIPSENSSAGCPRCEKVLGPKAQQVVNQLVELSRTGAVVNGLRVDCNECGADIAFNDLVWFDSEPSAPADKNGNGNGSSNGTAPAGRSFRPPRTRREVARELSDTGVTAASQGDFELARRNWIKAAEADTAWSVPFFNLAMLALDNGDPREAADYIELAEQRASKGTSSGDTKVLKQLPALRSRLESLEFA